MGTANARLLSNEERRRMRLLVTDLQRQSARGSNRQENELFIARIERELVEDQETFAAYSRTRRKFSRQND